jgi:hypothetical protein
MKIDRHYKAPRLQAAQGEAVQGQREKPSSRTPYNPAGGPVNGSGPVRADCPFTREQVEALVSQGMFEPLRS